MHASTVGLVLLAAGLHAVWNTAAKYKRGNAVMFVWLYTAVSLLFCVPLVLLSGGFELDRRLVVAATVSALLHILYSLVLQAGYERSDLGVVYPVARGTGPVLTMAVAVGLLGEQPGAIPIVGAIVIVAGVVVVAGNPFRTASEHARRGVAWGAATGGTIALYTLWDSYSVTEQHLDPVVYFTSSLILQFVLLTPSALRRRGHLATVARINRIPIVVIAVGSPLAYILVLTAMQTAPVALVAPLRESSIVIGSLLAWKLFGEGHLGRRLIGAAVVLAGIAAIAL